MERGGDSTTVPAPDALQDVYLEAEDLLPALESFAAPGERQPGVAVGARQEVSGLFSGSAGVLLTNLDEGTRLTLRFAVQASGAYGVGARIGVGPDHGIVQLAIDGRRLGERFDGYASEAGRSEELILGRVTLSQGDHTVTFTVVGKNTADGPQRARGLPAARAVSPIGRVLRRPRATREQRLRARRLGRR
jgi:hypothetical protein